jgi:hypothetical protein
VSLTAEMTTSGAISTRYRIALQGICNMRIGQSSWWSGAGIDWSCITTLYVLLGCPAVLQSPDISS